MGGVEGVRYRSCSVEIQPTNHREPSRDPLYLTPNTTIATVIYPGVGGGGLNLCEASLGRALIRGCVS